MNEEQIKEEIRKTIGIPEMDAKTEAKIKQIDKELEKDIFKLFELDKLDEIVLTKEQLKQKLPIIGMIYNTIAMKGLLEMPKNLI